MFKVLVAKGKAEIYREKPLVFAGNLTQVYSSEVNHATTPATLLRSCWIYANI